jgi:hypothetical protein
MSGANLYYRADRGGRGECKACRNLAHNRYEAKMPAEQKVQRLIEAARSGLTINNVCYGQRGTRACKVPHLFVMHRPQLDTLAAASPTLGKRLFRMFRKNELNAKIQGGFSRRKSAAPSIIRASDDIMDEIESAVPCYLPLDHRADVIQNISLAVLEGRLKRSEIAERAREHINAEYRINHNAWGPRSLDVPIYLDGNTTLLDTLTRGLWD